MKTLIFDMDDTLVNSAPLHKQSFHDCFMKYGVDINDVPLELEKTFFGKSHREIAKILIDYFHLKISVKTFMLERESLILDLLKSVEPMPGLNLLINFLNHYEGKRAIATSSCRKYVNVILGKFEMLDLFDVIITEEDIVNPKPHPEIFLQASKKLGINKSDCVVIEDSANGILAAKTANMKVIAIKNNKFDTYQDLSSADVILGDLGELENAIKRLSSDSRL